MFSKRCEYGLRALTVIGEAGKENRKVGIKEICKLANTPESFTAKILQDIVRRGIISSVKGPKGGFYFSKDLKDITIYDVVLAIDGDEVFKKCGLGLSECNAKQPCPLHDKFEGIRSDLLKMCKNNNLNDLLKGFYATVYER
jgi:Rrf2 family protein